MYKGSMFFLAVLSFLAALFLSCGNPDPASKIIVNINSGLFKYYDYDTLDVFNIENSIYHKLSGPLDSILLKIPNEVILDFSHGRNHSYIHLKPGHDIVLDTIETAPMLLGLVGSQSKENDYLVDFDSLYIDLTMSYGTRFLAKNEVDKFLELIDRKYASLNQLTLNIEDDPDVRQYFKTAMYYRYIACKGNDLLKYKSMYSTWHKRNPVLPDHFFDEVKVINVADPAVLIFAEGRKFGKSWIEKDTVHFEEDFRAFKDRATEVYPHSLLRDYYHYIATTGQIDTGEGIEESLDMIQDFKTSVTNKYLNIKLEEVIRLWLPLRLGSPAPELVAVNKHGDEVFLSELKGKKVYIDVWATWCPPCIAEIPFLRKLESELEGKDIEFVSISIDRDEDRRTWLKFIEDNDLNGHQWMTSGDWNSEFAIDYQIPRTGIPRFLYIDSDGKMINAHAPKPSNPKIMEYLFD